MRFTKELIEELGFNWVELEPSKFSEPDQYGQAKSKRPNGKRILYWNHNYYEEGTHHLTIKEDGGTRTVFHGKVTTKEDILFILNLVY